MRGLTMKLVLKCTGTVFFGMCAFCLLELDAIVVQLAVTVCGTLLREKDWSSCDMDQFGGGNAGDRKLLWSEGIEKVHSP